MTRLLLPIFLAALEIIAAAPAGTQPLGPGQPFGLRPQGKQEAAEFKRRVAQLAEKRLAGGDTARDLQDQALAMLDAIVCQTLAQPGDAALDTLNARLGSLVAMEPALGEGYRVAALVPQRIYALTANLGFAGPAAVRIYARSAPQQTAGKKEPPACKLAAQIDSFAYPDFFDESVELVPVTPARAEASGPADAVFVTVSGRTDSLRTGAFMAWRFHDGRLDLLWSSEILQQSSYEVGPNQFQLIYCADPDEDRPRVCRRMTRVRFAWQDGRWQSVEQADLPASKP